MSLRSILLQGNVKESNGTLQFEFVDDFHQHKWNICIKDIIVKAKENINDAILITSNFVQDFRLNSQHKKENLNP